MQKPSIGRIVLTNKGGKVIPAIIVRVWSDEVINVVGFYDGHNDFPGSIGETIWLTSVHYGEGEESPLENHWIWPPRI